MLQQPLPAGVLKIIEGGYVVAVAAYLKITESDVVATAFAGGVFKNDVATALTGGVLNNYRCYVVPLARSIQKLPKVMLLQQPWLAAY